MKRNEFLSKIAIVPMAFIAGCKLKKRLFLFVKTIKHGTDPVDLLLYLDDKPMNHYCKTIKHSGDYDIVKKSYRGGCELEWKEKRNKAKGYLKYVYVSSPKEWWCGEVEKNG